MSDLFNPLAMDSLAQSIVTAMMRMDPVPLDDVPRFMGGGAYAIYYTGDYWPYQLLSQANHVQVDKPIYVGKAVSTGGRKGIESTTQSETRALSGRLQEHAASVRFAQNLDIADFLVRWLVVEEIWIPLGESALLRRHQPVWNALVDGFGNHDPGRGRRAGVRSRWDTVHPGRPWSIEFPARAETATQIEQEIEEYLRSRL